MGRQQHFAGLHLVQWYQFEPCYKWESDWLKKTERNSVGYHPPIPDEKATTRLTDTVYDETSGRTATIVNVDGDRITLAFDDNNVVKKYRKKEWIRNVPLKSAGEDYKPIYAKVAETQSYICIRFGNIIEPIWAGGYLKPIVADDNTVNRIITNEEAVFVDETDQNIWRKGTRYTLYAAIPETGEGEYWAEYYNACLEAFKESDVNYIAIPYVYDICKCDKEDVEGIAFDTVIAWMKNNPDYAMRVIFLCTNIMEYKNYEKLIRTRIELNRKKLVADVSEFIDKSYAPELLGSARAEAFNTIEDADGVLSRPRASKIIFEEDRKQEHKPAERSYRMPRLDLVDCRPSFEEDIDYLISRREESFSKRLLRMMQEKGLDEAETYKKAFVDRRHFSKIKNDTDYKPTKKTVLAFAIAMELSVDDTKDLLNSAGFSLSNSSKFDLIVQYFLQHEIYDMFEINDVLYHFDQPVFE